MGATRLTPIAVAVALLWAASPSTAATLGAKGTYLGKGKVSVTDGNKHARQAGLVNRDVRFQIGDARVSGTAADGEKRSKPTDLLRGDHVVVRSPSSSVKASPVRATRVIVRPKPPKPPTQPPPVAEEPPPVAEEPPDAPSQHRGVGASLVWGWIPEEDSIRDLREAAALGADTVRIVFPWYYLQPTGRGPIPDAHAALFDRMIAVAKSEHLSIVALVWGTPCWASSAPRAGNGCAVGNYNVYPPSDSGDYGAFLGQLADRWGSQIAGYEVWNEPNHAGFWNGSPAQYVSLVRAADTAVAASTHPTTPIVAGALSGSDTSYLQKLYDNDVDRWSDAISIHPYSIRWDIGMVDPLLERVGDIWSFASGVPAVHTLMQANGDNDRIWITEFGYPTCVGQLFCVTADEQGLYLASALRRAAEWTYVDTFLMYDLRDWTGPGSDINQQFGVLNENWTPKAGTAPVKQALADLR